MNFLAISGSGRAASTNTAMLHAVSEIVRPEHSLDVFSRVSDLPVFSPDLETTVLPVAVQEFVELVGAADGIIIASPEYVRSIPGGLKNAIDWLVSRDEIIDKPIALMHGSHRGEDMLGQLRLVMSTVSERFSEDVFIKFDLMKMSPKDIAQQFSRLKNRAAVNDFLDKFVQHCT